MRIIWGVLETIRPSAAWVALWVLAFQAVLAEPSAESGKVPTSLADQIAAAKAGDTFILPPGTLKLGDVEVPAGVSLRGAGYQLTTLDATSHANGLICRGAGPATLSDLTVRGATETGILIDGASQVTIERVVVRHCMNGVLVRKGEGCHLRNLVVADNRAGVLFNNSRSCTLVNATIANQGAMAILLSGNDRLTIFNNILAGASLGVLLGQGNAEVVLDHNLTLCHFAGSKAGVPGNPARKRVEAWRDFTGLDSHSLTLPLDFADAAAGNYRPATPMTWAPSRATSSDWGVKELRGVKAPERDMDGAPRQGGVDLGAYEAAFTAPRPPDGEFKVKSGDGVTSAGLYTKGGVLVASLFQNLPLPKGTQDYWLPSRDWQGRPIPAGDYDLKLTESRLRLEYIAAAGNGDLASSRRPNDVKVRASVSPHAIAFDGKDRMILAQSGFENGLHVRAYDPEMKEVLWSLPGGGETVGIATDEAGRVHVLRKPASLIRMRSDSGASAPFETGSFEKSWPDALGTVSGMAALRGRLYVADAKAERLVVLSGESLDVSGHLPVPTPSQPAADAKTGLIWVISGSKELLAIDEQGQVKHRATPVESPGLLAVNNGRMAVYSAKSNQVTLLDCANPAGLKPLGTLGRGGSGIGRIQADKFVAPKWLAMNSRGDVAVVDPPRVIFLSADGVVKRHHMAIWGQGISWGRFAKDPRLQFFQVGGSYNIVLDPKTRTWEPGTFWRYTMEGVSPLFYFGAGGRNFGLLFGGKESSLVVVRMEPDGTGRAIARYAYGPNGLFTQRDANGDGKFDEADPTSPVLEKDGKPVVERLFDGRAMGGGVDARDDAALVIPLRHAVAFIPMKGLDADGVPEYDFASRRVVPGLVENKPTYRSPYDFTSEERVSIAEDMSYFDDGSFTAVLTLRSSGGPDLCTEHASATDMAGFDAQGQLRWLYPLDPKGLKMGFWGITTIGGITFAGRGAQCEYETMDRDGLGTGLLGTPPEFGWTGMWLDNHRQTQGFTGDDGKPYLVVGDYGSQSYHWLELQGHDRMVRQTFPVKLGARGADQLRHALPVPVAAWPVPALPPVRIPALKKPLPIDGDPGKWRQLGIRPILITPDLSGDSPANNSAVIRLAYHGENLYVHVIKFDNILTFHQSEKTKHYLQDSVEVAINTYPSGFKYNLTRLAGAGDVVWRDTWRAGWGRPELNQLLPPEAVPRAFRVLDDASTIEDRRLLEAAYGVDMRPCKVLIAEVMIPKSAMTPMENPGLEVDFAPGKMFLLGFLINDNDLPGSDTLAPVPWPVYYGTFERPEKSATAVFE